MKLCRVRRLHQHGRRQVAPGACAGTREADYQFAPLQFGADQHDLRRARNPAGDDARTRAVLVQPPDPSLHIQRPLQQQPP